MRKIVFQMMTTLNGRIDDPGAWVTGVSDDQYAAIDHIYSTYDTVLVGHTTAIEMVEYWSGAETDPANSDTVRSMAHRMNTYRKLVFTESATPAPLDWANVDTVQAQGDDEIVQAVRDLKAQPGSDIILSGGARLATTFVRLGLVDEYRLFVYPVVSRGAAWFDAVESLPEMALLSATTYSNGVVGLHYQMKRA